jgi:hypothetical protein
MSQTTQHIIVLSIVVFLAGRLVWQWVAAWRDGKQSGCGTGCSACPNQQIVVNDKPLVQLMPLAKPSDTKSL